MRRNALLVIDMLNDFLDPAGALYCGEGARRIIPVVRSLIDSFEKAGDAVIYLRDAHAPNDKEFEMFARHAVKGSWGSEIIPELSPSETAAVVEKTRYDGFYGNDLDERIARLDPKEVWVCGVVTSICVMDTVGELRNRDRAVVVPVGGVADFDPYAHEFALKRMTDIYGAGLVEPLPTREDVRPLRAL
ncbi:MAG: cysteine hydrolase family protein [Acidobacteriota bacterium]